MFRTNCIDCLDRTNLTQTKLTLRFLECVMKDIGVEDVVSSQIVESAKEMWTVGGDMISIQYTGAKSNMSMVAKTNKQGVFGKITQWQVGVSRYYNHIMND